MPGACSTRWATSCPPTAAWSCATPMALQAVDIVGQMLGHIAAVTRSADPTARSSASACAS